MAKMLISTVFTGIGSYIGGPVGGMIGGVVGSMVGNLLFPDKPIQVGPRLTDFTVVSTAYGEVIRDGWGTMPYPGHLIDSSDLLESKQGVTPQGKGMGGPRQFQFVYRSNSAYLFRRRQAGGFLRVWLDTKLIRNTDENATLEEHIASNFGFKGGSFTFYTGTETQLPDPTLESLHGVGMVPAYRGMVYLVADDLQLTDFGNRVPTCSAEIYDDGENGMREYDAAFQVTPPPPESPSANGATWAHVSNQGEIVAYNAAAGPASLYSDPANRVYRITPNGIFNELKMPWLELGGQPLMDSLQGHMDVEGYALTGTDVITGKQAYFVFDYSFGQVHMFFRPGTGSWSWIYLYSNECFYKFDDTTFQIAAYENLSLDARISAPLPSTIWGWDATLDFIYAIAFAHSNADPLRIYKIDRVSLTVVNTYTPTVPDITTGVQVPIAGITALNDNDLYFTNIGSNDGPVYFFHYNIPSGVTTFLGSAFQSTSVIPLYGLQTIYKNGVWYWGQQAVFGSGLHEISRFVQSGSGQSTVLSTIVRDCCLFAGIPTTRIDVTELTDVVGGYERDSQTTPADMIKALMNTYFFDACESDGQIKFKKRGRALSYSIPRGDLAAHEPGQEMPDKAAARQIQERQLPVTLRVKYIMKDHDYEKGMQYEERLVSDFRNIVEVDCPVSMTDTEARQIAGRLMPIAWAERNSREIALSRKYVRLEIADAFEVTI